MATSVEPTRNLQAPCEIYNVHELLRSTTTLSVLTSSVWHYGMVDYMKHVKRCFRSIGNNRFVLHASALRSAGAATHAGHTDTAHTTQIRFHKREKRVSWLVCPRVAPLLPKGLSRPKVAARSALRKKPVKFGHTYEREAERSN